MYVVIIDYNFQQGQRILSYFCINYFLTESLDIESVTNIKIINESNIWLTREIHVFKNM